MCESCSLEGEDRSHGMRARWGEAAQMISPSLGTSASARQMCGVRGGTVTPSPPRSTFPLQGKVKKLRCRHMHGGRPSAVPLALDRALDLRGELQQQAVIGLFCNRLDAERERVLMGGERQRDRGDAAEVGERGEGKVAPEVAEP